MRATEEILDPERKQEASVTLRMTLHPGHATVGVDLEPALVFLHIPKCGGNSFLDFLKFGVNGGETFDVNLGLQYARRLQELEQLSETERSRLRLISGHLPWGVHDWLPQDGVYVTLLRHPVDRIVSHYYFVKQNPTHPLYKDVTERRMSLADYATSGLSSELQDGQTRLVSGRPEIDSIRGHESTSREDLERARGHLLSERMHFGLVEHYRESQQLIARELNWDAPPAPTRKNVTRQRPPLAAVSRREWNAIAAANPLDMELYEIARREFTRRAAMHGLKLDSERVPTGPAPFRQRMAVRLRTRWNARRRVSPRSAARAVLERCGLDVRLRRNVDRARAEEKHRAARDRWLPLARYRPRTILDIGANTGQFAAIARHICPDASIICFEPLKSCCAALQETWQRDPHVRLFSYALGSHNGRAFIHRSEFSPSSSLLPMGELHREEFPHTAETTPETIEIRRLDDVAADLPLAGPVVAKIDVQGTECDVLDGGAKTIRACAALIVELSCYPLYERQPLFDEVYERLRSLGFVYRGNIDQLVSCRDGRILQCDGLFENQELSADCGQRHVSAGANTIV